MRGALVCIPLVLAIALVIAGPVLPARPQYPKSYWRSSEHYGKPGACLPFAEEIQARLKAEGIPAFVVGYRRAGGGHAFVLFNRDGWFGADHTEDTPRALAGETFIELTKSFDPEAEVLIGEPEF